MTLGVADLETAGRLAPVAGVDFGEQRIELGIARVEVIASVHLRTTGAVRTTERHRCSHEWMVLLMVIA